MPGDRYVAGVYNYRDKCISLKVEGTSAWTDIDFPHYFFVEGKPSAELIDMFRLVEMDGKWCRCYVPAPNAERKDLIRKLEGYGIETYEGDVSPINRFMTDNDIAFGDPRILYFDLETDGSAGWDDLAGHRILVIGYHSSVTGKTGHIVAGRRASGEKACIQEFLRRVGEHDLLVAWNGDAYDEPVLKGRVERHGLGDTWSEHWRGVNFLDMMRLFKKYYARDDKGEGVRVSFALDNIAKTVLGRGKEKKPMLTRDGKVNPVQAIVDAWQDKPGELAEYCERDVDIMVELEQKLGFISFHKTLSNLCGRFLSSYTIWAGYLNDAFVLRWGRKNGTRFRTKFTYYDERVDVEKIEGAYVMEPVAGMHDGVCDLDFASLYPNVIRTFNISPEVKATTKNERSGPLAFNGVRFHPTVIGAFPQIVEETLRLRKKHKMRVAELEEQGKDGTLEHLRAKQMSDAYKLLGNTMYGIMASPMLRYYDPKCGEAVTTSARACIQHVIAQAGARKLPVLYSDSVTGDRPLVLLNEVGEVIIDKAEEIWRLLAERFSPEVCGKSVVHPAGWKALAMDTEGRVDWFPLVKMICHRTEKQTWRISTKRGQTEVTTDHGIMASPSVAVTPERFLADGARFFCCPAKLPEKVYAADGMVDLMDYLDFLQVTRPYRGRVHTVQMVSSEEWVSCVGWKGMSEGRVRRFYRPGSEEMRSLLRVLGAFVSEGGVSIKGMTTRTRNMFSISNQDREWLAGLQRDLEGITEGIHFGIVPDGSMYHLRSGTVIMSMLFGALCGIGSVGRKVPAFLFGLGAEEVWEFYKHLEKGDGHVGKGGRSYCTISPVLTAQVSYLLSLLGREHSIHYRSEKGSWSLRFRPNGSERKRSSAKVEVREHGGLVYDLEVEGAHTFVDGIGRVLLHNTDSCFLLCQRDQALDFSKEMGVELDKFVQGRGGRPGFIRLDLDAFYDRIIFVTKKRYCGVKDTGKLDVKGLEFIRSDGCRIARDMQKRIIEYLLMVDHPNVYRAAELVETYKKRIYGMRMVLEDIVLAQSLGKKLDDYKVAPPHVRIAREMLAQGQEVYAGMKIPYFITGSEKGQQVVAHAGTFFGQYDADFYYRKKIYPPTQAILEVVFKGEAESAMLAQFCPKKERKNRRKA